MMVTLVSFTHASLSPLVASLDLNVHEALLRGPRGMVLSLGFPHTIQRHIVVGALRPKKFEFRRMEAEILIPLFTIISSQPFALSFTTFLYKQLLFKNP